MQRRLHDGHFTIERNAHALVLRSDPDLFGAHRDKIFFLTKPAQERPQRQSQQSQTPGVVCHVEAQLAIVETSPPSYIERLHFVFVVADEHKRSTTVQLLT